MPVLEYLWNHDKPTRHDMIIMIGEDFGSVFHHDHISSSDTTISDEKNTISMLECYTCSHNIDIREIVVIVNKKSLLLSRERF